MPSKATRGLQALPSEYRIVNLDRYCSLNPEGAIIDAQGL
jgi:hypothetical protein